MTPFFLSASAAIGGIALVSVGNGLLAVLVPLRMGLEQLETTTIGAVVACYPLGFTFGTMFGAAVIGAVGHVRAFCAAAGLTVATVLAFAAEVNGPLWMFLRFLTGFTGATLFMVVESWLNEGVASSARGRIMGVYFIVQRIFYGAGTLLIALADPAGSGAFMLCAVAYALCLMPIALNRSGDPTPPSTRSLELRWLWRISPVGVAGAIAAGLTNMPLIGIAPVYGAVIGLAVAQIAWIAAGIQWAGMALQYPFARWSDRMDRRRVLVVLTIMAAAVAAFVAVFGQSLSPWWLIAVIAIGGGLNNCVYPICQAHAADRSDTGHLVAVSGGLLLFWSLGAAAGPVIATAAMRWFGPDALFVWVAAATAALGAFTAWRITRRPPARAPD